MTRDPRNFARVGTLLTGALAALILAGCDGGLGFGKPAETGAQVDETLLIERDVEAPEVLQLTGAGVWDGRPSMGGVWVAHPDVTDPERVIIRNTENGHFVVGALFNRDLPGGGTAMQVSADAAEALGMKAETTTNLSVTALRRQTPEAPAETAPEADQITPTPPMAEAILPAEDAVETAALPAPEPATVAPTPVAAASTLAKPFIQVGIFSVQENATRVADRLRAAGVVPQVIAGTSSGRDFWRIVVGPAMTTDDRAALLTKIKTLGFADAYFVTN